MVHAATLLAGMPISSLMLYFVIIKGHQLLNACTGQSKINKLKSQKLKETHHAEQKCTILWLQSLEMAGIDSIHICTTKARFHVLCI